MTGTAWGRGSMPASAGRTDRPTGGQGNRPSRRSGAPSAPPSRPAPSTSAPSGASAPCGSPASPRPAAPPERRCGGAQSAPRSLLTPSTWSPSTAPAGPPRGSLILEAPAKRPSSALPVGLRARST